VSLGLSLKHEEKLDANFFRQPKRILQTLISNREVSRKNSDEQQNKMACGLF